MVFSVLLIEENPEEAAFVTESLKKSIPEPADILCCENYEAAFGPLFWREWDLVLVNYELSRRSGMETIKRVCGFLDQTKTPTIVYHTTLLEEGELAQKLIDIGVSDFVSKEEVIRPEGVARLLGRINRPQPFPHLPSA